MFKMNTNFEIIDDLNGYFDNELITVLNWKLFTMPALFVHYSYTCNSIVYLAFSWKSISWNNVM